MIIAPLLQALADPDVVGGRLVNVGRYGGADVPVVLTVELRDEAEMQAVMDAIGRARAGLTMPLGRRRR